MASDGRTSEGMAPMGWPQMGGPHVDQSRVAGWLSCGAGTGGLKTRPSDGAGTASNMAGKAITTATKATYYPAFLAKIITDK